MLSPGGNGGGKLAGFLSLVDGPFLPTALREIGAPFCLCYNPSMEILSKSLKETEVAAKVFMKKLLPRKDSATIVALSGDLGSGKTTFVQAVAKILGVTENITSPTFVLIKSYTLNASHFTLLYHIDAYRLKNGEEIKKLGWQEMLADPKNIIFIEWPENVTGAIPKNAKKIGFEFIDDTTRRIRY